MKRPSIQMYPADWRNNANLRRCSLAARGAWWEIMCVLHDSDEYGICRWPLVELLRVAGVPMKFAKELLDRNVMKGSENKFEGFSHTTRHAGQDGETFVLIPASDAPVWFSSRMVVDEFVRTRRGASTRFDSEKQPPSRSPTGRVGDSPTGRQVNGPTSSTPTPSSFDRENGTVELPAGFPKTEEEAKVSAQFVGCPEAFAIETWNKAMGRYGRDAKDIPIRSWAHYLKSEFNFQKNRTEKEKNGSNQNRSGNFARRVDRNQGTLNEGRSHIYAKFMDKQKAKLAADAKAAP